MLGLFSLAAQEIIYGLISAALFWVLFTKAGFTGVVRLIALAPLVRSAIMAGAFAVFGVGGWYEMLNVLPLSVPVFHLLMAAIGYAPLVVLVFAQWPRNR